MSKTNWTLEQEDAIKSRDCSLLVSAAAGAGKTAVLVERIVSRILDEKKPIDVDRLLVVTFTNAAAREMKERVEKALLQRLHDNPQDRRLQRQRLLIGKASISTLHSFCLEIVRQNYYRLALPGDLALDPRFKIADDVEGILLKTEVLEELLEEKYEAGDPAFLALVEGMGGDRDDIRLQDLILKLYTFSRSQPEPAEWLVKAGLVFQAQLSDEVIQSLFSRSQKNICVFLEEAVTLLEEAYRLTLQPGGPDVYSPTIETEIVDLQEILALNRRPNEEEEQRQKQSVLFTDLAEYKFSALKTCRGEIDDALKEKVQSLRNEAKKIIRNLQEEYLQRSPEELVADMQEMFPLMNCLCSLVTEFSSLYLQKKVERNILDFDDLEHFALNLLGQKTETGWVCTELAHTLRQRFEEVLVDEYQDINAVQEGILTLVSRDKKEIVPNLFMVGDVKQSIYGFRLAEPGLFLEKYHRYQAVESSLERKITLAKNFRSKKNIVDGVNFIFRQLMGKCLGGITYDRENELIFGAVIPPDSAAQNFKANDLPLEVHLIETKPLIKGKINEEVIPTPFETPEMSEELSSLQLEARLIGRRVFQLQKEMKVWDKGQKKYRPVEFRDMVILLRSTKNSAPVLLEEFHQMGLPAYAETGSGYFAAQEVQLILSLLKVIDNPYQDIPLTAVLLSPIVGISAEDIAGIRLQRPGKDFYVALCFAARKEREPLRGTLRLFLKKLRHWRTFARRNSLLALIWLLYQETGFYDYAGVMPGGKQRQANLRALIDRAKQFEDTTMKGLFKFLRFLKRLEETGRDLGTARALGENENVIRIMSIHKSKGLEFPVVFVGGLGKKFNLQDLHGDVLLDRDLGLGPAWVDPMKRYKYPTLAKIVVRDKLKEEMLAEEIRILYVAMTRARDALILVGSVKDLAKETQKWSKNFTLQGWELPASVLLKPQCPWDWLGPCLLRHRSSEDLRVIAGCQENAWEATENDPAPWEFYLWNANKIEAVARKESLDYGQQLALVQKLMPVEVEVRSTVPPELKKSKAESKYTEQQENTEIVARLNWEYPYQELTEIPGKLSVSEIKSRYRFLAGEEESQQFLALRHFQQRPQFLQEKGLSAGEKGSALHMVMRYLNLEKAVETAEVQLQIEEMVQRELITAPQAEAVSAEAIVGFIHSPLGKRIRKGKELKREVPFTLALPASELYPETENIAGEIIILQGTMDCIFKEGEEYVLVDYKTDVVKSGDIQVLQDRYKVQLELYARAIETIFAQPIKEKILYSFYLQEYISM